MSTQETIDLCNAIVDGLLLGADFRLSELNGELRVLQRQRETTITAWWLFSLSPAGQLLGCSVNGCYACRYGYAPHAHNECPRSHEINVLRDQTTDVVYALGYLERSAVYALCNLYDAEEGHVSWSWLLDHLLQGVMPNVDG
jgi:hypothetical protein